MNLRNTQNNELYLKTLLDEWKDKQEKDVDLNSFEYLRSAIDFLNEKVSNMSRSLKSWDLYNIKESADTLSEFNEKIGSIQPNSGLIITSTFDIYNKGDIVIKAESGNNIHIKAENSGIFFPSKIVQIGSTPQYELYFKYSSSIPMTGVGKLSPGSEGIESAQETFILENLSIAENQKDMTYGLIMEPENGEVQFNEIDGVKPIIKLYDADNQTIECEPILTLSKTSSPYQYILENIPSLVVKVVIR